MHTEYLTTRKTVVRATRKTAAKATDHETAQLPEPKGTFDLVHKLNGFTLIDACIPDRLARTFKTLWESFEG